MLTKVDLDTLKWQKYKPPPKFDEFLEADIDDLILPHINPWVDAEMTIRKYSYRYTVAYIIFETTDDMEEHTNFTLFGKYTHPYFEAKVVTILNDLIREINGENFRFNETMGDGDHD